MPARWDRSVSTSLDLCRHADDFPRYPDPVPDPEGRLDRWLEEAEIQPIRAREWKCLDGWHVGPRVLDDSFWFCFPNGRGSVELAEGCRSFRFEPGDLILVPRGQKHVVRLYKPVRTHLLVVHFQADLYGGINLLDLLGFPNHVPGSPGPFFKRVSEELVRESMLRPPGWRRTMSAGILRLLGCLARWHGSLFSRNPETPLTRELPRLIPSLQLMNRRLADPSLTVRDLALSVSLSETHYRNLFGKWAGASPVAYLQRLRIQRAGMLLRTTPLSIKQIAERSGFTDLSFFYRVFREITRKTPLRYRDADDA